MRRSARALAFRARNLGCTRAAPLRGAGRRSNRVEEHSRLSSIPLLHSRIVAKFNGQETPLGDFGPSEWITAGGSTVRDFTQTARQEREHSRRTRPRTAGLTLTGISGGLQKTVSVTVYDDMPRMAFFQVRYTNRGGTAVRVSGWTNHSYTIPAKEGQGEPAFWSYQSGSYRNRPDWVLPLKAGFKQDNFLGMNATDYGGGTPVSDIWRRDVGIAIGHLERVPKLVSLPVTMPDASHATLALSFQSDTNT